MWSRQKLRTFYLLNHSAYDCKTYHDRDIPQGPPNHKFAIHLNEAVLRGYVTN